ncbi:MAG: multidrug transporter, partial [Deltaproteobacteria bacterium]
ANIGVARAAFFPSITLTTSLGFGSDDLGGLFEGANFMWSFAPRLDLPIFDYGRRRANVEAQEIRQQIAVENYTKAVQSAFTDINNALVARESLERQFAAMQKSNAAVAKRLQLIQIQLREGIADGLSLLDAERESFTSQQAVLAMRLMQLNNRVDLYTALGGGLSEFSRKAESDQSGSP